MNTPAKNSPREYSDLMLTYEEKSFYLNLRSTRPIIQAGLTLSGIFDEDAIVRSLYLLVDRHCNLRTRFRRSEGEVVIREAVRSEDCRVNTIDLSGKEAKELYVDLVAGINRDLFSINLFGDLSRISLFKFSIDSYLILITIDHIFFDWRSFEIFTNDFSRIYESVIGCAGACLPAIDSSFEKYVTEKNINLSQVVVESQLQYWEGLLSNVSPFLNIPTDHSRQDNGLFIMQWVPVNIKGDLNKKVREFCKKNRVTLYVLLLSVMNVMCSILSGQNDIVILCPVSNRSGRQDNLIGCFVNLIFLRNLVDHEATFCEFVRRVRDAAFDAYDHQAIPYQLVVEHLGLTDRALFQVILDLNTKFSEFEISNELKVRQSLMEQIYLSENSACQSFDFSWNLFDNLTEIVGRVNFNAALFREKTIEGMTGQYISLLEALMDESEKPIGELII